MIKYIVISNTKYFQKEGRYPVDYTRCINFLLTISQHEVFLIFSEHLAEFGITPGQYGVLACLWKNETLTPKEIATILRVENSTISGVLDRMQKRGPYRPHPGPEKIAAVSASDRRKPAWPSENRYSRKSKNLNDLVFQRFLRPKSAKMP